MKNLPHTCKSPLVRAGRAYCLACIEVQAQLHTAQVLSEGDAVVAVPYRDAVTYRTAVHPIENEEPTVPVPVPRYRIPYVPGWMRVLAKLGV